MLTYEEAFFKAQSSELRPENLLEEETYTSDYTAIKGLL